jgi:hypothetical protein
MRDDYEKEMAAGCKMTVALDTASMRLAHHSSMMTNDVP